MRKSEREMLMEYLLNQIDRYEQEEREALNFIRYRKSDAVDCFELARAKDNYFMFLTFARDVMMIMKLYDDAERIEVKLKKNK